MPKNAFEQLLESIDTPEDRESLSRIATRYPSINNYLADPEEIAESQRMSEWAQSNYDFEHKRTFLEGQLIEKVQELEMRGDTPMDMNELNALLDSEISRRGLLTADQLKASLDEQVKASMVSREETYSQYFNGLLSQTAQIATRVPYLNQRHQREFGDMFDPDEFLTKARDAKASDLTKFYEEFTAEKRAAITAEKVAAEKQAEYERGKREAMQQSAMSEGQTSRMPTMDEPEIGHFQRKVMQMRTPPPVEGQQAEPELGRGAIATRAARDGNLREMGVGNVA